MEIGECTCHLISLNEYEIPSGLLGFPIELPTMARNPIAPIRIDACVMLEYGKQRCFRIKVDVFDFGVSN